MSDNSETAFPTQIVVTCGLCDDTKYVQWFCKWCAGSLCNQCKITHHRVTLFKTHVVVPRTHDILRLYGPSKIAEQCRIHSDRDITTYCNDCQTPCCVKCQVQNHNRHDISTIEDKYLSAESRLNDTVKELENDVMPKLEKIGDKIQKDESERRVVVEGIDNEVNAFRKEMKDAVDESCDDLLEKLHENDNKSNYRTINIESQKKKIKELIKEIDGVIQKGDLDIIKYLPPSPKSLIPTVPNSRLPIPIFTPGRDILSMIKQRAGIIEWTDGPFEGKVSTSRLSEFDCSLINTNKMDVMSFRSEIDITSITAVGSNTVWVMYVETDTMYKYTRSGKMERSIQIKGCGGIVDMVINQSSEMIVTCDDMKIRRVSLKGTASVLIDTKPFNPYGICLSDKEEIIVCMSGKVDKKHLAVYSVYTGLKLREMIGRDSNGIQQITDPYCVELNGSDVCVVNWSNVVCMDENDSVRWLYDGKQAKLEEKFTPRGLCVDKFHNLLVTDVYNNCVHYIDRYGRLLNKIITQQQTGFVGHWGISVSDKTGQVWVGNLKKNIVLFRYLT